MRRNNFAKMKPMLRYQSLPLGWSTDIRSFGRERASMYFAAVALTVLSGLLYAAGNHELGSFSSDVCRYGEVFCDSPHYVLVLAILAGVWGKFVSVR
jgi:hypothetical protein